MGSFEDFIPYFKKIMRGIAEQFGPDCEVVLHDYSRDYKSSIIAIENGHVTGRRIGDCGTNLGLEAIRGLTEQDDQFAYLSYSKDGKELKSTSVYFHDENGALSGALCMNWDISDLSQTQMLIKKLTSTSDTKEIKEIHVNKISDLLDRMIQDSIESVGIPVINMTKENKLTGLAYLDEKGAFLIKRAGDRISKAYCISKNTLYNYLEEIKNNVS